jgi:hypothetical protein
MASGRTRLTNIPDWHVRQLVGVYQPLTTCLLASTETPGGEFRPGGEVESDRSIFPIATQSGSAGGDYQRPAID